MSADLPLRESEGGPVGSGRALYFDSGAHRLFGWLHRPSDGLKADVGVVLCQPFGYEAICAHRGIRAFAESVAAAGMAALRFDYLGAGDSPDIDPEADQLQIWTQDILAAAEELRRRTGVRHVCLLGFRLGALLATLAASQSNAFSGLVAVSPIATGRRYLRELRTTRMAASLGVDSSEIPTGKQDAQVAGMEVSGFTLSAATLASLAKMDLTTLQSPPLPPMLIIENAAMRVTGNPGTLQVEGQTTRVALRGLVEMLMTPPQFAVVPKEVIAVTLDWLLNLPGIVSAMPDRSGEQPVTASDSTGPMPELRLVGNASAGEAAPTERPVFFGADALLFGIVTQPPATETRRRAVILLNAGADHHICASRLYVSMARRWAQHGYVVLRMDFGGVGDSGTRPGRAEDEVFPQEAMDDIRAAIGFLRGSYGVRDVTLAGLCSGAYHALRAAVAGLPVSRILMVNPQNYFWGAGDTLKGLQLVEVVHNPGLYRERIFSLAAWKRMVTGQVNILRIVKIYVQRPLLALESIYRGLARRLHIRVPNDLGAELEQVVARGVRVVFVFSRGEPGIELLKLQAGTSVERLAERCRMHIIDGGDHVFTRSGPRARMEEVVYDELFAQHEWHDTPSADLNTGGLKFE